MLTEILTSWFGFGWSTLLLISFVAFFASVIHGATGLAGGVVMAAVFSYILGIKVAIPVVTCALVISHFSRSLMLRESTDWRVVKRVLIFAAPSIVLGAWVFSFLDERVIALVFAIFLSLSIPVKVWAKKQQVKTGPRLLAVVSFFWGMLAGNVVGPGFFLAPFVQGTGMNRLAFVGTMAVITLGMNVLKLLVFGATALISLPLFLLSCYIGLMTVPGNWVGKQILTKMTDSNHEWLVNGLTVILIVSFIYLALVN